MELPPSTDHVPYGMFVPHVESINFDLPVFEALADEPVTDEDYRRCQAAADEISFQLLRLKKDGQRVQPYYWSYAEIEEHRFYGLTPLQIELQILRDQRRARYGYDTKYGVPAYVHGLRAIKLLFPPTDITPVLADITQLSFMGYTHGRKYLHLLGSMDAGKSSSTARLAILYMAIDPENTFGIVANPLLESADMTIYGDIAELYNQMCDGNPHPAIEDTASRLSYLFPDAKVEAKRRINFTKDAKGKGGWLALRSLKKEGVAIGAKGKGSDDRYGHGLFIFDEINRVENLRFRNDLVNVSAQSYFQMHSTQNPWDETDVGGQMSTPKVWNGWGWASWNDIRKDQPTIWPTVDSGIAYRINGLDAVNIRLGKVVYPYQFRMKKLRQVIEDKGVASPEYYSQVLGIFPGGDVDVRLLSQSRLAASRHDDEFFTLQAITARVLFADPAHTGFGDDACICELEFGPGFVTNTDGTKTAMELLVARKPLEYVKYIKDVPWQTGPTGDPIDFNDRFAGIGGNFNSITPGANVSYEQQIALRMAELARDRGILHRNVGYDFSMRPDMVEAVTLMMGFQPVAFNYNAKPVGYYLFGTKERTDEKLKSRTDELGYMAADVFRAKQLRGGQNIMAALIQLSKTRILRDKPGDPIEKKPDYKARNGNKSPDERDAFMGAVGMALIAGFRANMNEMGVATAPGDVKGMSVFQASRNHRKGLRATAKRF